MKRNKVVLFDGVCLFCEGWVNFVLDNAGKDKIFFIPLQKVELTDSSKEIIKIIWWRSRIYSMYFRK